MPSIKLASGDIVEERRGGHNCVQLEFIGKVKEFMENMKGFKATLFTVSLAIIIQVFALIYWGGMQTEKIKNIEKIVSKFDKIEIIYAMGEKRDKGDMEKIP